MALVMVVDDSRLIRDIAHKLLTDLGHEVIMAPDGAEALQLAREQLVDLVMTDINMPNMNGISLLSKLRRLDGYQNIPILMMTTETANYKKTKSKNMGANGWVQKPFNEERFIKAVKSMLENGGT